LDWARLVIPWSDLRRCRRRRPSPH
jgi:hypothetical protein